MCSDVCERKEQESYYNIWVNPYKIIKIYCFLNFFGNLIKSYKKR